MRNFFLGYKIRWSIELIYLPLLQKFGVTKADPANLKTVPIHVPNAPMNNIAPRFRKIHTGISLGSYLKYSIAAFLHNIC